ncbi:uncharacterized protein LOC100120897 isoform X5 [Nasonia vitripennis]|uniref:Uncharacterized protein n=1 Tax=Nasonia vitripennis TaxID=7425 RepID=A0A7M7PY35_NASVI|nr:uncharacterized protein LOC100120897 isoform X5 [Nasonia vitripennis]
MIIVHRLISVGYIRISIEHVPKSNIDSSSSIATDSRNTNSLTCNKKESRAGIRCSSSFHIGALATCQTVASEFNDAWSFFVVEIINNKVIAGISMSMSDQRACKYNLNKKHFLCEL